MFNSNPYWILRRVKRFVPPPSELEPVIQNLFMEYGNLICTSTGRRLFDNDARHQDQNMLKAIYEGQIQTILMCRCILELYTTRKQAYHYIAVVAAPTLSREGFMKTLYALLVQVELDPTWPIVFWLKYRLRHNIRVGTMNRYQRLHKGHYDPWLTEALLYLRMKLGIVATGGSIVEHGASIFTPGLQLQASDETFGVSRMAADVAEELGIHLATAVTQQQHNQHLPMVRSHALDISINILLPSGSTANQKNKRYVFLADKQGVKYAVTPIHT